MILGGVQTGCGPTATEDVEMHYRMKVIISKELMNDIGYGDGISSQ